MNSQQETTANTPTEPKLCKLGCGFFGSNATGDCCSRCWNEAKKKEGAPASSPAVAVPAPQQPAPPASVTAASTTSPAPDAEPSPVKAPSQSSAAATSSPIKKKKKKKMNYKNMMAGMLKESGDRDAATEKESIQKVTGGGTFVKIDKI